MKRQRNESDDGKRCVMRRALDGCRGEQRSGVVTVVGAAAAFKPWASHSPASSSPTTTFLTQLRALAQEVLTSSKPVTELTDYASKKFLTLPTHSSWEEECELVVTVLYMTLASSNSYNPLFVRGVVLEFFGRWLADTEGLELPEMLNMLRCEWKCTALSTLLLLHANLLPDECDLVTLEDTLKWKSCWVEKTLHHWLLNATACTDLTRFNSLLMNSAVVLKGNNIGGKSDDTYVGSLVKFLSANQLYKRGDFSTSIKWLQSISSHKCGQDLQGWILWLTGLGLLKLGKPHTALLKLKAAVDKCQKCIPAIFNIAEIFLNLGLSTAELESLSLLNISAKEKHPLPTMSLQSSILALHHTSPPDLPLRALFMLAGRCLHLKMYTEAMEKFSILLEKLENLHEAVTACSRTLLRPEDDVPELPAVECILVLAAMAHMGGKESENALRILSTLREKDLGIPSFSKSPREVKISCITAASGYLLRAQALAKIGKVTDALKECVRLEQALSWVNGSTSSEWDMSSLIAKTSLYQTLSTLHLSKQNLQSHHHYKRLTAQCSPLLRSDYSPSWTNLTLSEKLAMNNIYSYMIENINLNSL